MCASLDTPQPPATNIRQPKRPRLRRHGQTIIRQLPRRCALQPQQPHGLPHHRRQQHPGPHLRQATITVPLQSRRALPHRIHPFHAAQQVAVRPPLRDISPVRITEQPSIRLRGNPYLIAANPAALDAAPHLPSQTIAAVGQSIRGQPIDIATRIRIGTDIIQGASSETGGNPVAGVNAVMQSARFQIPLAQHGRNALRQQKGIIAPGIVAAVAGANLRAELGVIRLRPVNQLR